MDYEIQTLAAGTPRTLDYTHDQAGTRTQVVYPNGLTLTYTPTVLSQVHTIAADSGPLVEYGYHGGGHLRDFRRTTTDEPGGTTVYGISFGYDMHRRTNLIDNVLEVGGAPQPVASYVFTHDLSGERWRDDALLPRRPERHRGA